MGFDLSDAPVLDLLNEVLQPILPSAEAWDQEILGASSDIVAELMDAVVEQTKHLPTELAKPLLGAFADSFEVVGDFDPVESLVRLGLSKPVVRDTVVTTFSWEWWDEWVEMFSPIDEWRIDALEEIIRKTMGKGVNLSFAGEEVVTVSRVCELAVEASTEALFRFRTISTDAFVREVRSVLENAVQNAIDELDQRLCESPGDDSWEDTVLEALEPDLTAVVKKIEINLVAAVDAAAVESIETPRPDLHSAVEAIAPDLQAGIAEVRRRLLGL